jgi:uncharacterized protein YbbC (DUF1343 family)
MQRCRVGLDVLREEKAARLRGLAVGLVSHAAAVASDYRSAAEVVAGLPGVELRVLFGPEHGFAGTAQDIIPVGHARDRHSGLRVVSLYGDTFNSLSPKAEDLEQLDALVIDLVDIGSRYYTFQATMLLCLEAASRRKLAVLVLDRPNPLGGELVEGPALRPGFESFVGLHPLATRHGMTVGELARLFHAERGLGCPLEIIPVEGWKRGMYFDATGLPWVLPSPNMPALDTALVYPGQCLVEGTNLSEGRGTTRPFELSGAPWIDPHGLAERMRSHELAGVVCRPVWFQPTFHKHAGKVCGGVQIHVTDREGFQPVRTSLALLAEIRALWGEEFRWRTEPYEFVADRLAIDLLFGGDRERRALEAGVPADQVARAWEGEEEAFRQRRKPYLLY